MNFIYNFLLYENEGKINFLNNNYKKRFKKLDYDEEETLEIITKVYNIDLTGGKYCSWILDNILKLSKEEFNRFINEDLNSFKLDLNFFHNKIKQDLNQFNSINEFKTFIHSKQSENILNKRKFNLNDFKNDPNIILEYSDNNIIIIKLLNKESAVKYGKGTKWCTSSLNVNYFDHYNNDGPLYIYLDIIKNKKYQLHFESNQFMDESDSPININILNLNIPFFKKRKDIDLDILNEYIKNYKDGNFTLPKSIFNNTIIKLSNLKDLKILGDFDCSDNNLTSLKGCPTSVSGSFYCSKNQLTSLKGCPTSVNGDFYCNDNQLTSLEYCPAIVSGYFKCSGNPGNFTQEDIENAMKIKNENLSKFDKFYNLLMENAIIDK